MVAAARPYPEKAKLSGYHGTPPMGTIRQLNRAIERV